MHSEGYAFEEKPNVLLALAERVVAMGDLNKEVVQGKELYFNWDLITVFNCTGLKSFKPGSSL